MTIEPRDDAERPPDVKALAANYLMYQIGKAYFYFEFTYCDFVVLWERLIYAG